MNNTASSMTGMKPKDAVKLDTVSLNKIYPEETVETERLRSSSKHMG